MRIREKDGNCSMQNCIIKLQAHVQKLMIENGSLKSENDLLKKQVSFMEKLVLNSKSNNHSGNTSTDNSIDGDLVRNRGSGGSLKGSPFIGMAMVFMFLAITYLPEGGSGATPTQQNFEERILAEVKSGFNVFHPKSVAGFILSMVRSFSLVLLFYFMITICIGFVTCKRKPTESFLLDQILNNKKNS